MIPLHLLAFIFPFALLLLLRKPPHPYHSFAKELPFPPTIRRDAGVWKTNDDLSAAEFIPQNPPLHKPETAFVRQSDCQVYVTDCRGILWYLASNHSAFHPYAVPGGALLGGDVHQPSGALYVCDATRGLLFIPPDPSKAHTQIVASALSADPLDKITFCNDVHVAEDGKVYFTAASKLSVQQVMHKAVPDVMSTFVADAILGEASGRLLLYDPETRLTTQIADGLSFANGVAVHPSGQYALVVETSSFSIRKILLLGDTCGQKRTLTRIPGYGDGISYDAVADCFWVTLTSPITRLSYVIPYIPVFLRRLLIDIPLSGLIPKHSRSMIAAIDGNSGAVLTTFEGSVKKFGHLSAARRCKDDLWISLLTVNTIARLRISKKLRAK